ncbi:MAG: hypothetical protein LQ338_001452 [Usnochroma carphineum]|nr:MAG: hypothetical protein LQ338_001452 [Usnochroma carphineum]
MVTAELKFYAPPADGSKTFNYPDGTPIPEGLPKRNFGDADLPVDIHDIGDQDRKLLLENIPEERRIHLFDHTVRLIGGKRPPVLRVQIDQTPAAAAGRVRAVLPNGADELLKSRVRSINVWRPINGPVQCSPLTFADSKTVRDEALVAVEHRYVDRTGETISVQHMDEQWYYWSGIDNDERILLECFDSEKGGGCRIRHMWTQGVRPGESRGRVLRLELWVRKG